VLHRRDGRMPHLLACEQRRLEGSVVVVCTADGAEEVDWVRAGDVGDPAVVPERGGVPSGRRGGARGAGDALGVGAVVGVFDCGQEWVLDKVSVEDEEDRGRAITREPSVDELVRVAVLCVDILCMGLLDIPIKYCDAYGAVRTREEDMDHGEVWMSI